MKWFLGITLSVLLISGAVFGGVLYQDINGKLAVEQQKVSALSADMDSVAANISALQRTLGELTLNVAGVNDAVAGLSGKINSVENNYSALSENIGNLQSNLSAINNSVGGLQSSISAMNESIAALSNRVSDLQSKQGTVADIVTQLEPSVVKILCLGLDFFAGGSGVIVRSDGYVLTNYHVIEGAFLIMVGLHNGDSIMATLVAHDAAHDLAVLKLVSNRTDFPAAVLGSSAAVSVGEQVVAIGFPLLLEPEMSGQATFTVGIISAKRSFYGYNWLQTDAAINHGNSGGALVNMKGEVIGINTLRFMVDDDGYPIDNLGFAIPIDDAKALIAKAVSSP